jgi:purine nucleoside phosphorylase
MVTDHTNFAGTSPLIGDVVAALGAGDGDQTRFVDLTDAYSPHLCGTFRKAPHKIDIVIHEGVYAVAVFGRWLPAGL